MTDGLEKNSRILQMAWVVIVCHLVCVRISFPLSVMVGFSWRGDCRGGRGLSVTVGCIMDFLVKPGKAKRGCVGTFFAAWMLCCTAGS